MNHHKPKTLVIITRVVFHPKLIVTNLYTQQTNVFTLFIVTVVGTCAKCVVSVVHKCFCYVIYSEHNRFGTFSAMLCQGQEDCDTSQMVDWSTRFVEQ